MRSLLPIQPASHPLDGVVDLFRSAVPGDLHVGAPGDEPDDTWDLILVDYDHGDGQRTGDDVLRSLRRDGLRTAIVAVAEKGSVETAASAIGAGANDLLVRGPHLEERVQTLYQKVEQVLRIVADNRILREQNRRLGEENRRRFQLVGESPQILATIEKARRVAAIPRPVLITGERGTGKELVARAIHAAAGLRGPLVSVNCAAFADTLLESELFGHEKGAFTGADRLVRGKFELADGGTLFLDEIGHMSLAFQAKLLRVVEYGRFLRVGGGREIRTTARVIAATNVDLAEKMEQGLFLRDLHDRLGFEVIHVPPLRDRRGDIPLLANYYLQEFMREVPSLAGKRLGKDALALLRRYSFPGNVRELRNIIERAAYRDTTDEINAVDLELAALNGSGSAGAGFQERIEALERQLVAEALRRCDGSQVAAAKSLQMTYDQFRHYYRKHQGR